MEILKIQGVVPNLLFVVDKILVSASFELNCEDNPVY